MVPENGKPAITIQEFPTAPEASQALLSKNIGAQLEIAPAAQIIVDKSRGRSAISSTRWSTRCRWDLRRQRQHRAGGGDQGHPGHAEGQRPICRVDQKYNLESID